ncbi:MAG TPA: helix-turn-helix domain-containing protein, partial [Ignavibacteriaceae bacterium]|nr:helix-turn-helix domain-containing protein [Ignavibacteriaceae bacterium]
TLNEYPFPGNVRELENVILNAVAKTKDHYSVSQIELPSSLLNTEATPTVSENLKLQTIDEAVKDHIHFVMEHFKGNIQKAAMILGVSERTLQRRLQQIRSEK